MYFSVITIFPEIFHNYFNYGVVGRAVKSERVLINYYNLKNYADDKHCTIDDKPFGGGSGMLLRPKPLARAIEHSVKDSVAKLSTPPKIIYLSPQGKPISQIIVNNYAASKQPIALISGRYEGIDQRIIDKYVDEEYSIGDYVLSGGELPCLVLMDAIIRRLPGVLGNDHSSIEESFSWGVSESTKLDKNLNLLEYPQYTRPSEFDSLMVPEVLLNGNHSEIYRWRLKQSLGKTWLRRPNLLKCNDLTKEHEQLLEEFKQEYLEAVK